MPLPRAAVLCLASLLAACSFTDDTLLPTLAGNDPRIVRPPAPAPTPPAPTAATRNATLEADLQRVQAALERHRGELTAARRAVAETNARYGATASALESAARSGDARATVQRAEAEQLLTRNGEQIARLNALSSAVSVDGALATYVAETARSGQAEPGLDPTEKRRLAELEGGARSGQRAADQLLAELGGEIAEQSRLIGTERRRLAALGPAPAAPPPAAATPTQGERRPLITIRFDRPDTDYQAALESAVRQAQQRRPNIAFDVVAVSPPGTPPADSAAAARRNMASVLRSLAGMGFPADRLTLSSTTDAGAHGDEVRLYPR